MSPIYVASPSIKWNCFRLVRKTEKQHHLCERVYSSVGKYIAT